MPRKRKSEFLEKIYKKLERFQDSLDSLRSESKDSEAADNGQVTTDPRVGHEDSDRIGKDTKLMQLCELAREARQTRRMLLAIELAREATQAGLFKLFST